METELNAISDPAFALSFMLGCLFVCIKERTLTMDFALRGGRILTVALLLGLGLMSGYSAPADLALDPSVALVLGLSSVLFGVTALWTAVRGPSALIQAASTMVPIYGLAFLFTRGGGAASQWANHDLYQALSTEGLAIWAGFLIIGLILARIRNHAAVGA